MRSLLLLAGLWLVAACTIQPATPVPPEALEPLSPPPDTLELESVSDAAVAIDPQPVTRSTGQAGPGMLPGVSERESAPVDRGHFERRLQERQKRVHLGLDRPQREYEPVDNVLDFDF